MLLAQHNPRPIMRTVSCVKHHLVEPTTYCSVRISGPTDDPTTGTLAQAIRPDKDPSSGKVGGMGQVISLLSPSCLKNLGFSPGRKYCYHSWLPFFPSLVRKNPDFLQISHIHAPPGSWAPPKVIPFPFSRD